MYKQNSYELRLRTAFIISPKLHKYQEVSPEHLFKLMADMSKPGSISIYNTKYLYLAVFCNQS